MKVSILITAHKAATYLVDALASIRAQVHTDWELIVVEHGPPDSTREVIRDFGVIARRPVHHDSLGENGSAAAARNRLLELATGDPVAFLEPTDAWTPRHLANALQHLAPGVDLVVSDVRFVDRKSGRTLSEFPAPAQLFTNSTRTLFSREAIVSPSCVVFRRGIVERAGGFDARFRAGEARDFWFCCALKNARFAPTHRSTCQCAKRTEPDPTRALLVAENTVLFYEKHRDLAAVPAALRRRLLAASLVAQGRLLRGTDPARAARCFWRAWSLQPVHVQTLGQFALMGWRPGTPPPGPPAPGASSSSSSSDPRHPSNAVGNETVSNGS
jgi:glycosyltransferase involved in cell wall biosynthesis